ncbi:hypothetical protein [Streptomyces sp. NPDC088350]|uniref:hypothetical protein n=1 Tax=Streptomyces sp. NPDC088350 TaxID=3365854 RepID=UPI00380E651E
MSVLDVPGAQLYHEKRGSGPPLLMIPGASVHGRVFATGPTIWRGTLKPTPSTRSSTSCANVPP